MKPRDILIEVIEGRSDLWKVTPYLRFDPLMANAEMVAAIHAFVTLITLDTNKDGATRPVAFQVVAYKNNLDGTQAHRVESGWSVGTVDSVVGLTQSLVADWYVP